MPPKRNRSKERERKRKLRAKMTCEEIKSKNEKRKNERANRSEEWKESERNKLKERMRRLRARRKLDKNLRGKNNFCEPQISRAKLCEKVKRERFKCRNGLELTFEEKKEMVRVKRREKREKLKAAMKVPIKPFPRKELCEYEKIRNNIVQERQEAMLKSGLFDDVEKHKIMIGLFK